MSDTATVEGTGGLRPLHLAAKKGHDLLCKALLMAGADADAPQEIQGQYYSALHHAAAKGHTETTRILMRLVQTHTKELGGGRRSSWQNTRSRMLQWRSSVKS